MNMRFVFTEALASVVVFLVALPLCMGIAIASGVPPAMGLVSGIVGGLVVGALAGSPLQVSGPAAGLAVIVFEIVNGHGLEMLGPIVILAGVLQAAAGRFRLGQWFRAVAPAVIYGMLAGIGVLIFGSQFHVMVDAEPVSNGLTNLLTIPIAIGKGINPVEGSPHHYAAGVGVLTLSILVVWNNIRVRLPSMLKAIPAPLLAVAAAIGCASMFQLPIAYVSVPKALGELIMLPTTETLLRLTEPAVISSAVALAVIASAEALLCAIAVDKLHEGPRSDLDRELFAQGIGNTIAGILGALPVTGVIVRSTANVESGSTTRVSAVLHGIWLLLAVAAVPFLLELIPIASLAAILVYIGWRLVDIKIPVALWARGKGEFFIYLSTVVAIVVTNLLTGLIIGFALSVLKLAWSFSHLIVDIRTAEDSTRTDVHLTGSGTFVGLPALARSLEQIPIAHEVHIHLDNVDFIDHACFELMSDWKKQYESRDGKVFVEWESLAARGVYHAARKAA